MKTTIQFLDLFLRVAGPRSAVDSESDSRARSQGVDTRSGHKLSFLLPPLIQEGQLSVMSVEILSFHRKQTDVAIAMKDSISKGVCTYIYKV